MIPISKFLTFLLPWTQY